MGTLARQLHDDANARARPADLNHQHARTMLAEIHDLHALLELGDAPPDRQHRATRPGVLHGDLAGSTGWQYLDGIP